LPFQAGWPTYTYAREISSLMIGHTYTCAAYVSGTSSYEPQRIGAWCPPADIHVCERAREKARLPELARKLGAAAH
jgi:hypothetical protein